MIKLDPELARRAQDLLDDQLVKDVLASIEDRHTDEWRSTRPHEHEKRETAWALVQGIAALRAELHSIATSGKVARWNLGLRGKQP